MSADKFWSCFYEIYEALPRQGPGDRESTWRALRLLPTLTRGQRILDRGWKSRVKGRDWYDLVWYAANHPQLHLKHLEQRMIQSGH